MKVITVAIPVYNTENYLKRCLDSVLAEEVIDDIEVIAVNDGSKDKSLSILNAYREKYPDTLVVIDKENGGHGSTINTALDHASGIYFRVLDSDDWVFTRDFIELVKKLKSEDADLVVTNYSKEFVYDGHSEGNEWSFLEDGKLYEFDKIDLKILNKEYFVMANSVYRTEILKKSKLRLMEKTFYVDMQFNVFPVPCIRSFRFYDLDIYRYFIGRPDQSMNLSNFVKNRVMHEKVMKFLIEFYVKNERDLSENKKGYLRLILYYMLTTHYYIFCFYPEKGSKELYKDIRSFDDYLRNASEDLYFMMNEVGQIRYNRKSKFIFVRINPKVFAKMIQKSGRLFRKRG